MYIVQKTLITALSLTAITLFPAWSKDGSDLDRAWMAFQNGDAKLARNLAEQATDQSGSDAARHILVVAYAALGDYEAAIQSYSEISTDYVEFAALDTPIYEAMMHAGRYEAAATFAEERGLDPVLVGRAGMLRDEPLQVAINGVVEIPFTEDGLTPAMPGFAITANGIEHTARLDTGGAFAHVSPDLATELGIEAEVCATGTANLQATKFCVGAVDMEFAGIKLTNLPVAVIDALPSGELLGGQLGPVLGTNVLQQFLSTVDPHGNRMIFSSRNNPTAREDHLGRLGPIVARIPFLLVGDHFILAPGGYDEDRDLTYFVDSGLLAFDATGQQAVFMGTESLARAWTDNEDVPIGGVALLPGKISLGDASIEGGSMLVLPDDR